MANKILKYIGIGLSLLALFSLCLRMFSIHTTEGADVVIKGYNMLEYSPWGIRVIAMPVLMIILMLTRLDNTIKTFGILIIYGISGISLCGAYLETYQWISECIMGYIETYDVILFYVFLFSAATGCFHISCNIYFEETEIQ